MIRLASGQPCCHVKLQPEAFSIRDLVALLLPFADAACHMTPRLGREGEKR